MNNHNNNTEKKCNYRMHDKKCKEPLHDKKHCIFHSNEINGKKDIFNDRLKIEIKRQEKNEEKYDFTGFVFPNDNPFKNLTFEKKVILNGAQFLGKVTFGRTRFEEEVDFSDAQFNGGVSFWDAQFSGRADFTNSQFKISADFRDANFAKDAVFSQAQFSCQADFGGAKFHEEAKFKRSNFSGDAVFGGAKFYKDTSFREAQFFKEADFRNTEFSNEAIFGDAKFFDRAFFWKAKFFKRTEFYRTHFSAEASFASTQFSGETNFSQCQFNEIGIFDNVDFQKGEKCFMEETFFYDISGLLEFLAEDKKNKKERKFNYSHKTEFLPDHFRLILGEKAAAKYPIISQKIRDDIFLLSFKKKRPIWYFIWWLLADCGRGFFKWARWCLFMAFFFGFLYSICGADAFKPKPEGYTWFTFYYYSFVTFTTLGFGDITPIKWYTEILVTLEVIVGYGMLGGLISILANKLARRS
jgi:hypothetical protein